MTSQRPTPTCVWRLKIYTPTQDWAPMTCWWPVAALSAPTSRTPDLGREEQPLCRWGLSLKVDPLVTAIQGRLATRQPLANTGMLPWQCLHLEEPADTSCSSPFWYGIHRRIALNPCLKVPELQVAKWTNCKERMNCSRPTRRFCTLQTALLSPPILSPYAWSVCYSITVFIL